MSSDATSKTVYLVDAHSLIFQVFHAIRGMTSPTGLPTNAVFGFLRDMLFLRSLQPDYLLCAFDRAEPTFRSVIYPDYKAHRPPPPDDLLLQVPMIQEALGALGIPVLSVAGFEADDIMATVAKSGDARGLTVLICTADKDCRQLITDRVRLYSLRKREEFGKAELMEDWGVTPEQVVDLQSLVGDSVDNVPGVPGIGIKTGAKLLQEFGTLDNLLANADKVPGKKKEALKDAAAKVALSRQLVRLETDMPMAMDWESWKLGPVDVERMQALCREWGFHSLAGQIRAVATQGTHVPRSPTATPSGPRQADLFSSVPEEELFPFGANDPGRAGDVSPLSASGRAGDVSPLSASGRAGDVSPLSADVSADALRGLTPPARPKSDWKATYTLIDTVEAFDDLLAKLRKQQRFAIDLETTSLEPIDAEIVGIALSWQEGEAFYLALRGPLGSKLLPRERAMKALKPILETPDVAKVNQNIKYDLMVFRAQGISLEGVNGDPMIAHYLLHSGERSHGMEEMARTHLHHQVIPITDLIGKKTKKSPQLRMDEVHTGRVAEYAGEDADVAWRLTHLFEPQLDGVPALRKLYDELEVPLIHVLAEMEHNGIGLDVPYLKRLGQEMGEQLAAIETQIYALAGHPFNIGSLPQLRKVLFEEMKLPIQGRTAIGGAASTDQETLEKLAALKLPGSELPRRILEHRQIAKLKGTYVDVLPELVNKKTGRLHTNFNQTVAATGRLSASSPNLQNIPVRRENGEQVRKAFLPESGWVLLTADYSQIELRLLAHFCDDDRLKKGFAEGRDVHASVASQVFNVPESEVTGEQRRMAKTVNFGVIYGISPGGLAQRLGITRDEAAAFIKAYFARYPKVEAYQANLLKECKRTGFVSTILGRRRKFDVSAIRSTSSYQSRNTAEREAINMEVQGSAADLIKLAMLNVYRRLRGEGPPRSSTITDPRRTRFRVAARGVVAPLGTGAARNDRSGGVHAEPPRAARRRSGVGAELVGGLLIADCRWEEPAMDEQRRNQGEHGEVRATASAPAFQSAICNLQPAIGVIALLGGIGSGKSAVAAEFASRGATVIDADVLGHEALRDPSARDAIVAKFGDDVLNEQGEIERRKLGGIVFGDPTRRKELEAIVHPHIAKRIHEQIEVARQKRVPFIAIDAAVLLEAGWDGEVDHRVFVDAPEEVRWQRVKERGWSRENWLAREAAQLPLTEKRRNADHVLDNSSSREHLARQVSDLISLWRLAPSDSP